MYKKFLFLGLGYKKIIRIRRSSEGRLYAVGVGISDRVLYSWCLDFKRDLVFFVGRIE